MASSTPEGHLTWDVINYFGRLMTRAESLAYRTYLAEAKAKAYNSPELLDDMKTNDLEALSLMTDDIETFMLRVRDRIHRDHPDRVVLNRCPKCGGLAMTPKAQQCRWCHHDWHPSAATYSRLLVC